MIKFENVYLKYVNEFYSLFDFSCEINSHTLFIGDFFSGTTAIMRILSKIDKDYKGEIFIDGVNLKNIKDKNLNLAYLTQKPILFKNKSIFKNLYYPLKIRKIDKKSAKNLIYSIFLELKENNFNIFSNYLNNENEEFNINLNSQIENILKLKTKKLTLSEQKIITLIRAILRQPNYVLLENFFEDLDKTHISLAQFLINKLKVNSTIISCEQDESKFEYFKELEIINLNEDKEKKEG